MLGRRPADHAGRGGELVIERTAKARKSVSVGTLESSPFVRKSGRGGTGAHPLIGIQAGRSALGRPGVRVLGFRRQSVAGGTPKRRNAVSELN